MATKDTMRQPCPDPAYANETWRAKHHFKELDMYIPPVRRNRDFKATPYGAAVGMPNYRHATPYLLLKHMVTGNTKRTIIQLNGSRDLLQELCLDLLLDRSGSSSLQ